MFYLHSYIFGKATCKLFWTETVTCALLKIYSKKNSHFHWYHPLLSYNYHGQDDLSKLKCLLIYSINSLPITSLS